MIVFRVLTLLPYFLPDCFQGPHSIWDQAKLQQYATVLLSFGYWFCSNILYDCLWGGVSVEKQ